MCVCILIAVHGVHNLRRRDPLVAMVVVVDLDWTCTKAAVQHRDDVLRVVYSTVAYCRWAADPPRLSAILLHTSLRICADGR